MAVVRLRRTPGFPRLLSGGHCACTSASTGAGSRPPSSPRRGWMAAAPDARRHFTRTRATGGGAFARGLTDLASSSCAFGYSSWAFDTRSSAVGNRPWPGSASLARRGAPAGSVLGAASDCTLPDGGEQARVFVRRRRRRGAGSRQPVNGRAHAAKTGLSCGRPTRPRPSASTPP